MADWKDTMFFWRGEMTTGDHGYGDPMKPNEIWGFKGTWSGVEAAEPPPDGQQDLRPSEDAFAADAANEFHVEGGVGTKQQMLSPYPPDEHPEDDPYRDAIEGETWQLCDGYPAWYMLDNGEGHEKYSDDKHVLRTWFVSRLPPLKPPKNPYGDDFERPDYSNSDIVVVAKGSNEFAKFIALGIWPQPSGPMVLARRYLDDRDPRNKMSHQQILATVPEDLLAAGKPWNADIMATKWSKSKGKGKKKKVTETDNSSSNVAADMTAGDAGHDAKRQKTKG